MLSHRILLLLLVTLSVPGCEDTDPRTAAGDASLPTSEDADVTSRLSDAYVDAAAARDMSCRLEGPVRPSAVARRAVSIPAAAGIDDVEHTSWLAARRNLLASPGVHYVATYHHGLDALVVASGPPGAPAEFTVRAGQSEAESDWLIDGDVEAIFPNIDALRFPNAEALWETFENPMSTALLQYGYRDDDPRVGYLPEADQFFPRPFERLMTLFEAENAPDLVYGVRPFAAGGIGTHGGLSGLQSRAPLILSGPGVRKGVVLDEAAALVDIAPTVLAALGAGTTAGRSTFYEYDNGLYLARQDGRVLLEAWDETACHRPEHAVVIIFDGLQALEINRQLLAESPELELPNFRRLTQQGTLYRYGALSGFPSYSAPGHSTVGTGAWPGHHGVLSNRYFDRSLQQELTPFDLITGLVGFISEPESALDLYRRLFTDDVENLAQAAHRAFGRWNDDTKTGAFVAVLNELTFMDADFSTLSFFSEGSHSKALPEYRIADGLAVTQIQTLFDGDTYPTPKILQLSFLATDAAGESDGPHSPLLRDVLEEMDARLGTLIDAYERRGALDKTLFVLTADHGMELQDPQRRADVNLGVRASFRSAGMVYLKTLDVQVATNPSPSTLLVTVLDHDNDRPIADAQIRCPRCMPDVSNTDSDGIVRLDIGRSMEPVEMEVTHPEFNQQTLRFLPLNNP